MSKELSYLTPEGFTVFTSSFLKNRGTCCKSICLHCPYGFTLKKIGIQFKEVTDEDSVLIKEILEENNAGSFSISDFPHEHIRLIFIKEKLCGVFFKNKLQIKHLFLKKYFQEQGLSKEMVESYFFI